MANAQTNGKARGNGPVSIAFIDADGKPHKRITTGVSKISGTDKRTNKAATFDMDVLETPMIEQLAAGFVGHRMLTNVRNVLKQDEKANIIEVVQDIFDNLKANKVYTRGEGKGATAARPFDYNFWREVMTAVGNSKGRKVSPEALDGFQADLMGRSPRDRWQHVLKLQQDPHVKVAVKAVRAKRGAAALKKGGDEGAYDALAALGV